MIAILLVLVWLLAVQIVGEGPLDSLVLLALVVVGFIGGAMAHAKATEDSDVAKRVKEYTK